MSTLSASSHASSSKRTLSLSRRTSLSTPSASTSQPNSSKGRSSSFSSLARPNVVASSLCRQDARLGITTAYRDLSLHSACAHGNVGLVQYALTHGQPVNSVLNGVLPLHAAASSGSETVVRMLIEAGADVNSPRLPRRYSNERSKASGLSVGTQGSTPLHFAAANGHVGIIKLLLTYGADPRIAEKHGVTPDQLAVQNGHDEAAALLRSWAPPPPSNSSAAGEDDDVASLLSTRSSLRNLGGRVGKKRLASGVLHPQRSFDALATKLHQHAAASSTSIHSLASLASSTAHLSPNPSSSQISLGAVHPTSLSAPGSPSAGASVSRRVSLPSSSSSSAGGSRKHRSGSASGWGGTTRRPSLPSVWEKAAHPRAAIRNALGMTSSREKGGDGMGAELGKAGGSSRGSLASSIWDGRSAVEEDEAEGEGEYVDEEGEEGEDEQQGAELAERRRSMEVHRPLRQDSFQGALASLSLSSHTPQPPPAPPPAPAPAPAPVSKSGQPVVVPALARAASQHQFYRPRQSSQLSTQSFSGRRPSVDVDPEDGAEQHQAERREGDVFEDSPPPSTQASPSRPRAFSNPLHGAGGGATGQRSPLLQQVQFAQQQAAPVRERERERYREPSGASLSSATEATSRPSTAGTAGTAGGALADSEFSSSAENDSGGSGASRPRPAPANLADVRRGWTLQAPPSPSSASASSAALAAAAARNRSNSASTDGAATRFSFTTSSSPDDRSTRSGPSLSTYTASTAPTSVAPSSPGPIPARAGQGVAKRLAPLYEGAAVGGSGGVGLGVVRPTGYASAAGGRGDDDPDGPVTSRAQARKRVQQAERELLRFNPSSASLASNGSGTSSRSGSIGGTGLSLKDQLAAYGKSLRVERDLAEREEREKRRKAGDGGGAAGGFTLETIGTSSKAPAHLLAKSASSFAASPAGRAPPSSLSGLLPPSALSTPSSKHAFSPSSTPRASSTVSEIPHDAALPATKDLSPAALPPPARTASPTSTRSGKSSSVPLPPSAPPVPVLGHGPGGVSFVPVQAPSSVGGGSSSSPHTHHTHKKSHSDRSHSDKGGTSITSGSAAAAGGGKAPTTRVQIEEDRKRREEMEGKVPRAVRTVPEKKRGLRKLFGGGGGSGGK
ncbi:hypothetical protein JCM8097_007694 [Rhodosporidiobolus ruineniae]